MKHINLLPFILIFIIFASSCKPQPKYHYAIADFKKSLQPCLTEIVNAAVVGYPYEALVHLDSVATDKDWEKLTLAENPILRATALKYLLNNSDSLDAEIVINHLDDTALVATNRGEFGVYYFFVSDYVIENTVWKNQSDKDKTIERVITKHNYLKSAYTVLDELEPQEKYYSYIKSMAQHKEEFRLVELALFCLAKYKRQADVSIIKEILLDHKNNREISKPSFELMRDYPADVYIEVLEQYANKNLFKQENLNGINHTIQDFFQTVASYKNEKSADLLQKLLSKTRLWVSGDGDIIKDFLNEAIWSNRCTAYAKLTEQIKPMLSEQLLSQVIPPTTKLDFGQTQFSGRWSFYTANTTPVDTYPY